MQRKHTPGAPTALLDAAGAIPFKIPMDISSDQGKIANLSEDGMNVQTIGKQPLPPCAISFAFHLQRELIFGLAELQPIPPSGPCLRVKHSIPHSCNRGLHHPLLFKAITSPSIQPQKPHVNLPHLR
jgi:hypothetical protein